MVGMLSKRLISSYEMPQQADGAKLLDKGFVHTSKHKWVNRHSTIDQQNLLSKKKKKYN